MCFPLFPLCKCDHATLSCFEHSKGRKPGKHEGASRTAHTAVEITVGWRKGWRQNSRKIALSLPYHCLINKEQCIVHLANLSQRTSHSSSKCCSACEGCTANGIRLVEMSIVLLASNAPKSSVRARASLPNMHRNLTKWPTSFCSRASEPESGHEATGACTWPPREWPRAVLPCDFLIS